MAGVVVPSFVNKSANTPPIGPQTNSFGSPSTFSAAVNTQASDYDSIMKAYKSLLTSSGSGSSTFSPVSPTSVSNIQIPNYSVSSELQGALTNLSSLSATGGYSDQDIQDLRARGVGPIRSIYQTAQRNLDRTKSLQGGYSPNYTAASAKMAREQSEEVGNAVQNVNAGIANSVAANKLSASGSYATLAAAENARKIEIQQANAELMREIAAFNANAINSANQFNAAGRLNTQNMNLQNLFRGAEGMANLYSSSPGLVNTFGSQVAQAANSNQNQQQINNNNRNSWMGFALG